MVCNRGQTAGTGPGEVVMNGICTGGGEEVVGVTFSVRSLRIALICDGVF